MILDDLIARDGGTCVWCSRDFWRRDLTAEHLLPRARGGRGEPENLAVACRRCNRRRKSRAIVAYVRVQREAGFAPRIDLIEGALTRLSTSSAPGHADYARRQLQLLARLPGPIQR